jgi:hypothetical protein
LPGADALEAGVFAETGAASWLACDLPSDLGASGSGLMIGVASTAPEVDARGFGRGAPIEAAGGTGLSWVRAGRRTTTHFFAGISSGERVSTGGRGGGGSVLAARRRFGGMCWTTTGGWGAGWGLTLTGISTRSGGVGTDRLSSGERLVRGARLEVRLGVPLGLLRRGVLETGEAGGAPSAARTCSSATARTSVKRSATNAATVASISALMLIVVSLRTIPALSSTILSGGSGGSSRLRSSGVGGLPNGDEAHPGNLPLRCAPR